MSTATRRSSCPVLFFFSKPQTPHVLSSSFFLNPKPFMSCPLPLTFSLPSLSLRFPPLVRELPRSGVPQNRLVGLCCSQGRRTPARVLAVCQHAILHRLSCYRQSVCINCSSSLWNHDIGGPEARLCVMFQIQKSPVFCFRFKRAPCYVSDSKEPRCLARARRRRRRAGAPP